MGRRRRERLYGDLAPWWPLVSAPADYREEAGIFLGVLERALGHAPRTILELGSGGGNNASHMKRRARMTLVDASPGMLRVSRRLNPDCTHRRGDMRTVRLGRLFDAVFVHDAASYLRTEAGVRATARTAAAHLRPGGVALLVPDRTAESFREECSLGGHDEGRRGLRYLAWTRDRDPGDGRYQTDYAFLLRDGRGRIRTVTETHRLGLFPRALWLGALRGAGFRARALPFRHSTFPRGDRRELFVGVLGGRP
jgi:SAM-dependent methyltransferase